MTDDTTDETETIDVDLSADDAPAEPADEPEVVNDAPAEADTPSVDDEKVKQEAIRRRENAPGDTQIDQLNNAIEQANESLRQNVKQLQQLAGERSNATDRIERLRMTRGRVLDQRAEYDVVQTLAGGISLEVPHDDADAYDRKDLCEEIDETIDALEGKVARLEEKETALEQALHTTKAATDMLEQTRELVGDDAPPTGGSELYAQR